MIALIKFWRRALLLVALLPLCECTSQELRGSTIEQGKTVSDLLEQMVLDNLEMIRQDPGALPWHLKVTQGTTTIQDQLNAPQYSYTWPLVSQTILGNSLGQRQWQLGWTVVPVIDGATLLALQQRYQYWAKPQNFDGAFTEGSTPPESGPFGRYGSIFVWPRPGHRQQLTAIVADILTQAPVTASERTIALPGPKSFK
jgi:hypothetical protein